MKNYYVIFEKTEKFCPISLDGILHTAFYDKNPFESKNSDFVVRNFPRDTEAILPEEFWFITADRKYDFDFRMYRGDSSGYFVSSKFLSLLLKFDTSIFQYKEMNIVNKRKEQVSSKEYFYIRFYSMLENAIDMDKSNIELYRSGQDAGKIKKIWDLQLKGDVNFPDVFLLNQLKVYGKIFCSEKFKVEIEANKMKGIICVPASQADTYKEA